MAQYFNDFSSYTLGSFPSGWSVPFSGSGVDFSIISYAGHNAVQAYVYDSKYAERILQNDTIGVVTDGEVLLKADTNSTASDQIDAYLRVSGTAITNLYCYTAQLALGTQVEVYNYINGSGNILTTIPFSWAINQSVWMRFRVSGTNLFLRVWIDGNTEPSTWTWTGTDTNVSSGKMGIGIYDPAGVRHFQLASMATGVDSAPTGIVNVLSINNAAQAQTADVATVTIPTAEIAGGAASFGGWGVAYLGGSYFGAGSTLSGGGTLVIANGFQQHASDNLALTIYADLIIAAASQSQTATSPLLAAYADLLIAAATQAQTASNTVLQALQDLIVQSATQGNTMSSPLVTVLQYLLINNSAQTQAVQNILLDQRQQLFIDTATMLQASDEVYVRLALASFNRDVGAYVEGYSNESGLIEVATRDAGGYSADTIITQSFDSQARIDELGVFDKA